MVKGHQTKSEMKTRKNFIHRSGISQTPSTSWDNYMEVVMNKKLPDKGCEPRLNRSSSSNSIVSNSCGSFAGMLSIVAVFALAIIGTSSSTSVTTVAAQTQNDTLNNAVVAGTINLNDTNAQMCGMVMKGDENNPVFKVGNSIKLADTYGQKNLATYKTIVKKDIAGVAIVATGNENKLPEVGISVADKITTGDAFAVNSQSFADGLGGGHVLKMPMLTMTTGGEKGSLGQYSFGCERNNLGDLNGIAAG
jgi:hypothetical protein